ncbi:Lip2 [Drosophila busckii]|uniref:Lipase n=1 Tax=Drosophila busckii TaxID=30019 RepID=A0A0M4DZP0_DROBS|nr:Lip2 [Drosophila busckii]
MNWLQQSNYSHELHNVTTADGYQLQLQRLPRVGARPVLLLHGLLGSALSWLCLGAEKSLGFQLHRRHYDVWLANLRGSAPHGRHHLELTDVMLEFWRYSFHEHGAYDLPAIIDHIVEHTKRGSGSAEQLPQQELETQQILLIGHSQAFNAFLVLCALQPRYQQHIALMQALAPLTQLHEQVRFDARQVRNIMKFVKTRQKAKRFELFPVGEMRRMCNKKREQCEFYAKTLAGSALNNKKLLEIFNYDYLLQGGSARELQHLQQLWKSGDFIAYDYGPIENLQVYQSIEAMGYNLSHITVPIILYFGETDAIATPEGVHSIYARMLNSVRSVRRIGARKFNHFDFLIASEVKTLVNDKLIELMEQFLAGKLSYVIE